MSLSFTLDKSAVTLLIIINYSYIVRKTQTNKQTFTLTSILALQAFAVSTRVNTPNMRNMDSSSKCLPHDESIPLTHSGCQVV